MTAYDWLLLAGLVTAWGSSFAMSKVALEHVAPAWIAAARLCIGAGILVLVALLQRAEWPTDRRSLAMFAWLGLVGNAAPFFIITWGMQFITSGVAGLLMGTIPLIVIVMAHFLLPGERLNPPRVAGFILGFIGIVVLMGPENLINIKAHGQELIGELAVVLGCMLYGINAISAKRFGLRGTVASSAGVLVAGAILATTGALLQSPFDLHQKPAGTLLALFGLGLIPTGIATVLWFKAVERTSPTFTSMSNYLVPVYALLFGAFLLGEHVGWNVLVALLLILCGIFLSRMPSLRLRPWR
ncbi:MAG: DMT family transporter [Proteobacteria bacterium]|nr:DMT family transporter [Pseudomonadota bacterium]